MLGEVVDVEGAQGLGEVTFVCAQDVVDERPQPVEVATALGQVPGGRLRRGKQLQQVPEELDVDVVLGALGAFWLSRYLVTLLFGVRPFDALTYSAVAALLLATAVAACYIPGRRAMNTDPATALRIE